MSFAAIPVRANGQDITHAWFNLLRTAGLEIENFLGAGYIQETSVACANNQLSSANVTGLLFDKNNYVSAIISAEIRRKTDDEERVSLGYLKVYYKESSATWELVDELSGDEDGVIFSISSGGQVQYTSDDMSGLNYEGAIKFKATTFLA